MGTTATSNLALIKPDTLESIKPNLPTFPGWAFQNGQNCDKIDALFRASNSTWTPLWTGTSNPAVGTGGFIEGKYLRLFPRLVIGFFRIFTGTASFTAGSGSYSLSIPVPIASELDGFNSEMTIGKACFLDASAVATCSAFNVCYSPPSDVMFLRAPTGDTWSATNPVVPAVNDRISGYFMYPTSTP